MSSFTAELTLMLHNMIYVGELVLISFVSGFRLELLILYNSWIQFSFVEVLSGEITEGAKFRVRIFERFGACFLREKKFLMEFIWSRFGCFTRFKFFVKNVEICFFFIIMTCVNLLFFYVLFGITSLSSLPENRDIDD